MSEDDGGNGFQFDKHLILDYKVGTEYPDLPPVKIHNYFTFQIKSNAQFFELHGESALVDALQKPEPSSV